MAVKDAEAVAKALTEQGFKVTLRKDLPAAALDTAFRDFFLSDGADPEARLLVWFAGHGHTISGEGYLVPADGFAIDPRAEAYANGTRSPYEPLRMVPRTWRLHRGLTRVPFKVSQTKIAHLVSSRREHVGIRLDRFGLREEVTLIARLVGNGLLIGCTSTHLALKIAHGFSPMPSLFKGPMADPTWLGLQVAIIGALVGACIFVLGRTATRIPRPRPAPPTLEELLGLP